MACLLKLPYGNEKGVVSFTTQERDRFIKPQAAISGMVHDLKRRWVVGLHHNWHDHRFRYDPLFDFSMAGDGDLIEVSGREFTRIGLDACNFSPAAFAPSDREPFWDVLYVSRAVYFKRIPEFFQCVRKLFDHGHALRILHICPIPPYKWSSRKTEFYGVRDLYEAMFNLEERKRFTLLTTNFDYPFPFDLETLAHFYRSSRVFVHMADDERRCRVAGYAWASGMPVVGHACVGSLLPKELRQEPVFYEAHNDRDFPDLILKAINRSIQPDLSSRARKATSETFMASELVGRLAKVYFPGCSELDQDFVSRWRLRSLDIRLGRHHGVGRGPNTVPGFMRLLEQMQQPEAISQHLAQADMLDPEVILSRLELGWSGRDVDHLSEKGELLGGIKDTLKSSIKAVLGRR